MSQEFTIRRKVLSILHAKFHLYDGAGNLVGFCKQKAFKLKEDIRVFVDESELQERLAIKARSIIDFGAAYDVIESATQTKLGALKRKGWSSVIRDSWVVMDENDQEIGAIQEDSMFLALVRRFLTNIVPQNFHMQSSSGTELARFKTHFNPFVHRMTVSITPECHLNPMMVLAAGLLLVAIEGRQK